MRQEVRLHGLGLTSTVSTSADHEPLGRPSSAVLARPLTLDVPQAHSRADASHP
jgi:hypothetical protein